MIDLLPSKHFCLVFFGLSLSCTVGIPSWFEISDAKSGIVTSGLNIYKSLGHAVNPQLDTRKNFLQTRSFPFQAKETKKNILKDLSTIGISDVVGMGMAAGRVQRILNATRRPEGDRRRPMANGLDGQGAASFAAPGKDANAAAHPLPPRPARLLAWLAEPR